MWTQTRVSLAQIDKIKLQEELEIASFLPFVSNILGCYAITVERSKRKILSS